MKKKVNAIDIKSKYYTLLEEMIGIYEELLGELDFLYGTKQYKMMFNKYKELMEEFFNNEN